MNERICLLTSSLISHQNFSNDCRTYASILDIHEQAIFIVSSINLNNGLNRFSVMSFLKRKAVDGNANGEKSGSCR